MRWWTPRTGGWAVALVCDNLNRHTIANMRRRIGERGWLSVEQLPRYDPGLDSVEGVWAAMRSGLPDLVPGGVDQLAARVRARLKPMQYRFRLLKGCLVGTGLSLGPQSHELKLNLRSPSK